MTCKHSISGTVLVKVENFLWGSRFKNVKVLNDELVLLCPSDPQASLSLDRIAPLAHTTDDLWIEQVKDLFIVNLQEADKDTVVACWLSLLHLFNPLVQLIDASLCDSTVTVARVIDAARGAHTSTAHVTTFHSVGLARTCLTICENCTMVALKFNERSMVKDSLALGI